MIRGEALFDTRPIKGMTAFIQRFPLEAANVNKLLFDRHVVPVLRTSFSNLEIPRVKRPIEWSNKHGDHRQRKAFFATNGFGGGIPTKRTGRLLRSFRFRTEISDRKVYVFIENAAKYFVFVMGRRQQPFHRNTGWPLAETQFRKAAKPARAVWRDGWKDYMRDVQRDITQGKFR